MIVIIFTFFVILTLLILKMYNNYPLVNKEEFNTDDIYNYHINQLNNLVKRDTLNDYHLSYNVNPYNEVYQSYFDNVKDKYCQHVKNTDYYINKYESLEEKYNDLKRKINPKFNDLSGKYIELNKYEMNTDFKFNTIFLEKDEGNNKFYILNSDKTQVYNYKTNKFEDKDTNNNNQKFSLNIIYNKFEYEEIVLNPNFRKPENHELLSYPIVIIRAENGSCITIKDDAMLTTTCKFDKNQMFRFNR